MTRRNKQGQALGRKGAGSRARLLEAARGLIEAQAVEKLTASGVARAAGLVSQTFYLYFDDIDELLLWLSREAAQDTAPVVAELEGRWDMRLLQSRAERFIAAFYQYWDRNRAILNIRNFRADSGQEAFIAVRNESTMPIVNCVAEHIRASHGENGLGERHALARAVIIVAAIERMASRYAVLEMAGALVDSDDLKQAEADILLLLMSPPPK